MSLEESCPPRILEIGEASRMAYAFADTTEFFSTFNRGSEHDGPPVTKLVSAKTLIPLAQRLFDPTLDLIVVHASPQGLFEGVARTIFRRDALRGHLPLVRIFAQQLLRRIPTTPVAVLDLEDSPSILPCNEHLLEVATLYFKRELPPDRWRLFARGGKTPTLRYRQASRYQHLLSKIRPLSLGIPAAVLNYEIPQSQAGDKDIDVFFSGRLRNSSTVRERGASELVQLANKGLRIEIGDAHMSSSDYLARCARSWLVWAPEGYGWDCFRPYEAALVGSVPLISRQTIERHMPLVESEHCIYYDLEIGELTHAVRRALKNRVHLVKMAEAARAHVLRHHTPKALAQHVAHSTLSVARRRQDLMFE